MKADQPCTRVLVEDGGKTEGRLHPLAVEESSHGNLGKTGSGARPKAQGTMFRFADGEVQVQSRLEAHQNTAAEVERSIPALL